MHVYGKLLTYDKTHVKRAVAFRHPMRINEFF